MHQGAHASLAEWIFYLGAQFWQGAAGKGSGSQVPPTGSVPSDTNVEASLSIVPLDLVDGDRARSGRDRWGFREQSGGGGARRGAAHHDARVVGEGHRGLLEARLGQLRVERAEPAPPRKHRPT